MMNEKLLEIVAKSGKSAYRISKETGIPYTTISELLTGKKSTNSIAAETLCKICLYFECEMLELMDYPLLFNNISGKYKKINYKWLVENNSINLYIIDNNDWKLLASYDKCNTKHPSLFANACAEIHIDDWIKKKEREQLYEKLHINA